MSFVLSIFTSLLIGSSALASDQCIPVSKPSFNAERVEFNPISKKYRVLKPYYTLADGSKRYILYISGGGVEPKFQGARNHLCTFLGYSGGRNMKVESSCDYRGSVFIYEDASYDIRSLSGDCHYHVDSIECDL